MDKKDVERLKNEIIEIHDLLIKLLGGEAGLREEGGIYYWAYKTLFHLHKTKDPFGIGAFVLQDLAQNHYFVDGNKRTAYVFTKYILLKKGKKLLPSYIQALDLLTEIASYKKLNLNKWLKNNSIDYEKTFKGGKNEI
jgi:death-on-curing family protein